MATTKFEITINIEVVDVGNVPANSQVISESAIKAIEAISAGNINVIDIHTSQKTFPNGLLPHQQKLSNLVNKS